MIVPRVGFTQSSYTVVEEAGLVSLQVTSDGSNPDPVEVTFTVDEENRQGVVLYYTSLIATPPIDC